MKIPSFYLILVFFFFACSEEKEFTSETVSAQPMQSLSGEVFLHGNSLSNYESLCIRDALLGLLDNRSDTVLQVFGLKDAMRVFAGTEINHPVGSLSFIHTPGLRRDAAFLVMENDTKQVWDISFRSKKDPLLVWEKASLPFSLEMTKLPRSYDYYVTPTGIYAADSYPERIGGFYCYQPDKKFVFPKTHDYITSEAAHSLESYRVYISVNDACDRICAASRYTNTIHFYYVKTNAQFKRVQLGEELIEPFYSTEINRVDPERSRKCFTEVYGTKRYVYCLYSGSTDFSAPSLIAVFTWDGKFVRTFQLDRPLSTFTMDEKDDFLWGISRNQNGGTDVVKYKI